MREYLIGTGGWGYFQIPGANSLATYSKIFNFVEVNSTFYHTPSLEKVEKWRELVPPDFKFSVRAHRSITHTNNLKPVQEIFVQIERMREICRVLRSEILHLQVSPSFKVNRQSITDLQTVLSSTNLGKLRLALELRETATRELPRELISTMQDHGMVHCVDLSKNEKPAYESDILYTRLFGKGNHNIYQPTDQELATVDSAASESKSQKIVMSFHFVKMYKDAARLKTYKQTGKFPMITRSTGLSSLQEVLNEDASFPSTRNDLLNRQGWKLVDITRTERVRAEGFLGGLPDRTYESVNDIMRELESVAR